MDIVEARGRNGIAKVFTDFVEEEALNQITAMMDADITKDTIVRIMPDCHAGKGSTIGTTIRLPKDRNKWKVSPSVVGVDVGCGLLSYKLKENKDEIDLVKLDKVIRKEVPLGFLTHNREDTQLKEEISQNLTFKLSQQVLSRAAKSMGTLGGGNHFIELGEDEEGEVWLTVHTGSRNLGLQVAEYHQRIASSSHPEIQTHLAYLEGKTLDDYLNDMKLAQNYASNNRLRILEIICSTMKFTPRMEVCSVHNAVFDDNVIRKGAVASNAGEKFLLPFNMRDGILLCEGLGNEDWNNSAPHGAGRVMSRTKARKELSLSEFKRQMDGIFSTSVSKQTLDEAPNAYKDGGEIEKFLFPTARVLRRIRPFYNLKG